MLPTMWAQKLNKLDDGKKFLILNWGIGIESEIWKQVRKWKQVKDVAQSLLYVEQKLILRHLLFLF